MNAVEIVYLSQAEVMQVGPDMEDVILTVERVLGEHGQKRVENPPKLGVHPQSNAFLHAMPAFLPHWQAAGMKWVSSFPSNHKLGLPAVMGLIVLNDVESGQPLAIMDCSWITAMRTSAVSAVSAKYLANPGSTVIGMIGAGVQGRYNLLAIQRVLPALKKVKVFDILESAAERFAAEMSVKLGLQIQAMPGYEAVIHESDVVVTATGKLEEVVFFEKWVSPGTLVLPVHHRGWENRLLHQAEKFITDDWEQLQTAHRNVGGFDGPLPVLHAELGEIILGKRPGRQAAGERIVAMNYGLAIEDIAVAREIYHLAVKAGAGTRLTLIAGEN